MVTLPAEVNPSSKSPKNVSDWTYERVQKEYERVSELKDDDDFDCKICRRNFSTKAYLKSHLRAHRAPLK